TLELPSQVLDPLGADPYVLY
nr:cytochrome P-450 1,25-dihydroxyvitamin D3 24-hydroxylase, 24-hydroxylase [chickens, kidney, Peptide Mitochondrial Partial, 20 aa] [Gallus gallus]